MKKKVPTEVIAIYLIVCALVILTAGISNNHIQNIIERDNNERIACINDRLKRSHSMREEREIRSLCATVSKD